MEEFTVVVIGRFEFVFEVLVGLWFVKRGSGDCDVLFAVSFLCAVERRRGLVLGKQRLWPSDACYCGWGSCLFVAGEMYVGLTTCFLVQLGDRTKISRSTPVAVVGLGSGVAMLALGWVRLGL